MMQARKKGEVQWYRPDRDAVNGFNVWLRQTIVELDKDTPEVDKEVLAAFAADLARLSADCAGCQITEEQLHARFKFFASEQQALFASRFMEIMFCNYRKWCAEMAADSKPAEMQVP
jgi:hypothetical protein